MMIAPTVLCDTPAELWDVLLDRLADSSAAHAKTDEFEDLRAAFKAGERGGLG